MEYREILNFFKNRKKILDAGCGSGRFVSLDKRIIGIDSSVTSPRGRIFKGSVTKIPFPANHFDGVLSYQVIEHLSIEQAYKMLSEVHRVLKKGGVFVMNTPCVFNGFWNTFSHVKPYPAEAVRSLIHGQQGELIENFPPLGFEIMDTIYDARGFPGIGVFRLTRPARFLAKNLKFRRHDYTMILRKI